MNENDDAVERLLKGQQPRTEPAAEVRDRVRAAVDVAWQAKQTRQRRRYVALAASVLLMVGATLLLLPTAGTPTQLLRHNADFVYVDSRRESNADFSVPAGGEISVDVATRLTNTHGVEFRMRPNSTIRWHAENDLELIRGAIYVDSQGQRLSVRSDYGSVRNVGTRFMLDLAPTGMTVAVRSGAVNVETSHGTTALQATHQSGQRALVTTARTTTDSIAHQDERWQWIYDAHPAIPIETLRNPAEVLQHIADELEMQLQWNSEAAEHAARDAAVSGRLKGLGLYELLDAVLAINALERRASEPDVLLIGLSQGPEAR